MNNLRIKCSRKSNLTGRIVKNSKNFFEKQKKIQKTIKQTKQQWKENMKNQEKFEQTNERILQKSRNRFKNVWSAEDPKMKELMEKTAELMQQMEKIRPLPDDGTKWKMEAKNSRKNSDRMMELFKTLEVEQKCSKPLISFVRWPNRRIQTQWSQSKLDEKEKKAKRHFDKNDGPGH